MAPHIITSTDFGELKWKTTFFFFLLHFDGDRVHITYVT